MDSILEQFLVEKSVFGSIALYEKMIEKCSNNCRGKIKNTKNYQSQVSVCTSACKISNLRKLLHELILMKQNPSVPQNELDTKIGYIKTRLQNELIRFNRFKVGLRRRQTKIPVSMSLKPSPDRYDPSKFN